MSDVVRKYVEVYESRDGKVYRSVPHDHPPAAKLDALSRVLGVWRDAATGLPMMRRYRGVYEDGVICNDETRPRRPGKKARETWPDYVFGIVDARLPRAENVTDAPSENFSAPDMVVRYDRKAGVAYTYTRGHIPESDELSPWRRGVIR